MNNGKLLKYSKLILNILVLLLSSNIATATVSSNKTCIEKAARFKIITEDIKNLKLDNTILSLLVKASGKEIDSLLENDQKTLKSFSINYSAKVRLNHARKTKKHTIIQYGLYKTLDPQLQLYIEKNNPDKLKICYYSEDPVRVEFIIDSNHLPAPVLLTDTIDKKWQKKVQ